MRQILANYTPRLRQVADLIPIRMNRPWFKRIPTPHPIWVSKRELKVSKPLFPHAINHLPAMPCGNNGGRLMGSPGKLEGYLRDIHDIRTTPPYSLALSNHRRMPSICVLGIQSTGEGLQKRVSFWHSGPSDVISVTGGPWGSFSILAGYL